MPWDFSQEYACISFDRVVPEEELRSMLAELAINLLDRQKHNTDRLDQLEDTTDEIESGEITREQGLEQIIEIFQNFLREIDHGQDCTNLIVLAEYNSEYYDTDMAREIAKHLFAKTNRSHFVWRRAAFDKHGAYSHQWIGFWANTQIELVDTDEYFAKQFAVQAAS